MRRSRLLIRERLEWKEKIMKATQVLMEEHRVIERVITSLEIGADRLENGSEIGPEFFLQATAFIKGFADGCHHKKEEGVLFPAMEQHGIPSEGGPIGVMLQEHEAGRVYTRAMYEAAQRLQSGETIAQSQVIENARKYAVLLRQHIFKEDHILFPLADRAVPLAEQDQVWEGFEHVEHVETGEGVHEKYLALAEALEGKVV
jgi:hemerythrin-like domain-containing protein